MREKKGKVTSENKIVRNKYWVSLIKKKLGDCLGQIG